MSGIPVEIDYNLTISICLKWSLSTLANVDSAKFIFLILSKLFKRLPPNGKSTIVRALITMVQLN